MAGSPGDPQSWNRYPYGRNDPIDITDPSGKSWWSNLLIDVGIGVIASLLPEIAPAWFGAAASTAASTTGGTIGTTVWSGDTIIAAWGTAVGAAAFAGAAGVEIAASSNPQPQTPQQRFDDCNSKFGDANSQAHLDYNGYQMAQNAANSAGIGTNQELALWDNEQSFQVPNTVSGVFPANSSGAQGPMQITPAVRDQLNLPSNYASDTYANLLAGARYYSYLLSRIPATRAAAGYLGTTRAASSRPLSKAQSRYQKRFDSRSATMQKLVNCVH
jgi:hypothetical protein